MLHINHRTFLRLSLPLWIISYVLATFVRQICLHTLLAWYTTHGFPKHTLLGPFSWIHMATYYWHHKFTSGWSTSVNQLFMWSHIEQSAFIFSAVYGFYSMLASWLGCWCTVFYIIQLLNQNHIILWNDNSQSPPLWTAALDLLWRSTVSWRVTLKLGIHCDFFSRVIQLLLKLCDWIAGVRSS